jgi:nitroreductase
MEGFDSKKVKKLLQLPRGTDINMIISCGIRDGKKGIWGDRCRLPFEEVYERR